MNNDERPKNFDIDSKSALASLREEMNVRRTVGVRFLSSWIFISLFFIATLGFQIHRYIDLANPIGEKIQWVVTKLIAISIFCTCVWYIKRKHREHLIFTPPGEKPGPFFYAVNPFMWIILFLSFSVSLMTWFFKDSATKDRAVLEIIPELCLEMDHDYYTKLCLGSIVSRCESMSRHYAFRAEDCTRAKELQKTRNLQ